VLFVINIYIEESDGQSLDLIHNEDIRQTDISTHTS